MKKCFVILAAAVLAAGSLFAETDYVAMEVIKAIQKGSDTKDQIVDLRVQDDAVIGGDLTVNGAINGGTIDGADLTGNVALARQTNAIATLTGTRITNTCVAATGQTNTYVFIPFGTKYLVHSITTSP